MRGVRQLRLLCSVPGRARSRAVPKVWLEWFDGGSGGHLDLTAAQLDQLIEQALEARKGLFKWEEARNRRSTAPIPQNGGPMPGDVPLGRPESLEEPPVAEQARVGGKFSTGSSAEPASGPG